MSREKLEKKCTACKVAFTIALTVSIALIVTGFFIPPRGVIDGGVLKAVGELFAFAALAVGAHALTLGYDLKIIKDGTTIDVNNNNDETE